MVHVPSRKLSIEEIKRRNELSERRRYRALTDLPLDLLHTVLEADPQPIIIYEDRITYANPAAIDKLGYSYEELLTFNDVHLDTGTRKERLDDILKPCARQGWDDLDLVLSIPTLDKQQLLLEPRMHHHRINDATDYWIGYIQNVRKIETTSLKGRTLNALHRFQRVFQRDRQYVRAPETVDKEFIGQTIKKITDSRYNLVIDFKKTTKFAPEVVSLLKDLMEGTSFKEHVFLVNANEQLYHLLISHKIPAENLNCYRRQLSYVLSPA